MKKNFILVLCCLLSFAALTQRVHVGVFGGLAAYNGDLTDKLFPKKVSNGAIGLTVNYEIADQLMLRAGFTYSVIGGADRFSDKAYSRLRNLSFETSIMEFSTVGEYYLFNLYEKAYSPYAFAGLAVFHYDPYAYNGGKQKVFLKPLSTEGQGVAGYPDRKTYSLTQLAIPLGGGIKFAVSDNFRVGLEVGLRKLFTDYLDDASKTYINPADLLAAKGQLAVDMSYRGDEVSGGSSAYPPQTDQRGNPKNKDSYYFAGIHLTYKLGNSGGGGLGGRRNSKTGCPTNVY